MTPIPTNERLPKRWVKPLRRDEREMPRWRHSGCAMHLSNFFKRRTRKVLPTASRRPAAAGPLAKEGACRTGIQLQG
jgi:hypothetical protein